MKSKKTLAFFAIILLFMSTVLGACSGQTSSSGSNGSGSSGGGVVQMKIATASTSGAYYPIGGVMASILSENMEGYNFTAEATGGSEENARLIDSGSVGIGFFGTDSLYNAYNGLGAFEGKKIDKLRSIARVYVNHVHIVTLADNDINTVADLEGKTVAVGAPGSGTSNKAEELLKTHGLTFGDNIKADYLGFKEGSEALVDGIVDAVIISVGIPSGNIQELGASHDIKLVQFTEEMAEKVVAEYPYYSPDVIAAGTYDGIDEDVLTMVAPNEIAVDASLDEELVYEMTKLLFETHLDEFKGSHSVMETLKMETLPQAPIPLHPGAERFYKEKGLIQ